MSALLAVAKKDLDVAELIFQHYIDDSIMFAGCYHLQQCAEKCLKAIIELHGKEFSFTHDINKLLLELEACHFEFKSQELLEDLSDTITSWATKGRYEIGFFTTKKKIERVTYLCNTMIKDIEEFITK